MAVEKITVSLPVELVAALDRIADAEDVSRSSLVKEAAARYVTERTAAEAAGQREASAHEALELLASLAERGPATDRPVLEILRELRGPLDEAGEP